MRLLDKYILVSTIFSLFTEDFNFHYIIDWKFFYIILFSNFLLLSINKRIFLNKNMLILYSFIIVHGVISFIWLSNPIKSLLSQVLGIIISSTYFYSFLRYYNLKKVINMYIQTSFFVSIISMVMFFLDINVFTQNRLNGVMTEPAHYAAIMLPAIYLLFRNKNYIKLSIVLLSVLLSRSSIGYLGLLLILLFPLLKSKYLLKYGVLVLLTFLSVVYYVSSEWNSTVEEHNGNVLVRRLKETEKSINSFNSGKFENYVNLSSYAFLSNAFITKQIFLNSPFGTGIGSYQYQYDKYFYLLRPPEYLNDNQKKINKTDANSLFFRMIGDLGIFAFLFFVYFLIRAVKVFGLDKNIFAQATFFYLIVKLIREGHYFPPEFYFFVLIFIKNHNEDITYS